LISQRWKLLTATARRASQHRADEYFAVHASGHGCSGWG
jgi:hypothetical protein